jgi:hypothetical protein
MIRSDKRAAKLWREHMEKRAQGWFEWAMELEDWGEAAPYDPTQPISVFNHPDFMTMPLRAFRELERSWP